MADLVKWKEMRLPGTCQTMTDVDEATGELVVTIWGEPPAPGEPPTMDEMTGQMVSGKIQHIYAGSALERVVLRNVKLEPLG